MNEIILTDCIDGMKNLEEKSIDLIVTSPPYYNSNKKYQRGTGVHYTFDVGEPLYVVEDMFEEARRVMKDDGFICINLGFSYGETGVMRPATIMQRAMKKGWFVIDTIIWKKTNPIPIKNRLTNAFEYIYVLARHPFVPYPSADRIGYKHNIIETSVSKDKTAKFHSAVFPIEVPKFCIDVFSNEGDIVLDPFMGSGTTALACIEMNRNYLGFEANPEYVEKSIERVNDFKKGE